MKFVCILFVCFCINCFTDCSLVFKRANRELGKSGCNKESRAKANTCADMLWFAGRKSRKYPENESDLQKHCKQTSNLIKCVKDHTDLCGNEVQQKLANVLLFTYRTNDKSYCTKSAKRLEFMNLGVCGNQIREESTKCMDDFLLLLGKSSAYETRFKVPHACCAFHKLKSCIMTSAQESNHRLCSEKSMDNLEKYINSLSGNTINLMCAEYEEDSDKCQHLPHLPKGTKFSKALSIIEGFANILKLEF